MIGDEEVRNIFTKLKIMVWEFMRGLQTNSKSIYLRRRLVDKEDLVIAENIMLYTHNQIFKRCLIAIISSTKRQHIG